MTPEQERLHVAALALGDAIQETVPDTTIHWAVETARSALANLVLHIDTVKTFDAED